MQYIEYRETDKSEWGPGPWQDEPDKIQFVDEQTRLPCLVHRGPSGALCGYVGVPNDHPFYGKDYGNSEVNVDVHGGLTFADSCHPRENGMGVCHKVEPGESDDVWWLGFDCAHCNDLCPAYAYRREELYAYDVYRDLDYVKGQIASLAKQISAAA